jgi:NCS1 family nucleobase:cation symporter-1
LLSLGLTVRTSYDSIELMIEQAMISAVIGQLLVAACVVMTGLFGAKWHVGFPMWNRVVWGLRASYFPLANRIVLSFTWCASESTYQSVVIADPKLKPGSVDK